MGKKRTRGLWTNDALKDVMDVVKNDMMPINQKTYSWNIHFFSLWNHFNGRITSRKIETSITLSKYEKAMFVKWVASMQDYGHGVMKF